MDVVHAHELLHGQECQVHGDSGYTGTEKRDEITTAQDEGRLRKDIERGTGEGLALLQLFSHFLAQ